MRTHTRARDRFTGGSETGYTLLEVLMAISIFMIGILAIGSMQTAALKGNSNSEGISQAVQLAQRQIEELMSIPYDPASLAPELDPAQNANRLANPPVQEVYMGKRYRVWWEVVNLGAINNTVTIRVTVERQEDGRSKRVVYDFIRTDMI